MRSSCHCEAPKGLWQSHKEGINLSITSTGIIRKGIPTGLKPLGMTNELSDPRDIGIGGEVVNRIEDQHLIDPLFCHDL